MRLPMWRDATSYPNRDSFREAALQVDDPFHVSKSWAWQFLRRNHDYRRDCDALKGRARADAAHRWGLTLLWPYQDSEPACVPFASSLSLREGNRMSPDGMEAHDLCLRFDLRLPIEKLLEVAAIQLREAQQLRGGRRAPARKRKSALARYLRVIDAHQQGVPNREIAAQFIEEGIYHPRATDRYYDGQSQVERDWAEAQELMELRYLSLAWSSS